MMNSKTMTANEIRQAGFEAIQKSLGVAGLVRFCQQFERGQGDYSVEREALLGSPTVAELVAEAEAMEER